MSDQLPVAVQSQSLPVSIEDMERGLHERSALLQRMTKWLSGLLVEGVDYGKEPGIEKPFIHKPGLEKLAASCGCSYRVDKLDEKELAGGHLEVVAHMSLVTQADRILGQGVGSCSTMEGRYRFRNEERKCPTCGKPAIIKGKKEYGGGFLCFKKKGGCGAKFDDNDPVILDQQVGRVEHDNPADYRNTVRKMALIRASRDVCCRGLGVSGIFGQDEVGAREEEVIPGAERVDMRTGEVLPAWDKRTQNRPTKSQKRLEAADAHDAADEEAEPGDPVGTMLAGVLEQRRKDAPPPESPEMRVAALRNAVAIRVQTWADRMGWKKEQRDKELVAITELTLKKKKPETEDDWLQLDAAIYEALQAAPLQEDLKF
jgi:hypothetical protein